MAENIGKINQLTQADEVHKAHNEGDPELSLEQRIKSLEKRLTEVERRLKQPRLIGVNRDPHTGD